MKSRMINIAAGLGLTLFFGVTACKPQVSPDKIEIHDIQGCDHVSPLLGKSVNAVEGIVTRKTDNGFVMQSAVEDERACSSEAIFVHSAQYFSVVTGDLVSVSGRVAEFTAGTAEQANLSQTEITDATVKTISHNSPLPKAVLLGKSGYAFKNDIIENDDLNIFDPEQDGLDYFESLEWMRVELPAVTVVGPRNRYNEIVVVETLEDSSDKSRESAAVVESENDLHPERVMIKLPGNWSRKIDVGDRIEAGLVGILTYSFGNYKIEPLTSITPIKFEGAVKQKESNSAHKLRIATYNINNFSQYSSNKKISTLARQMARDLDFPDLLILQEVQDDSGNADDGSVSATQNLEMLTSEIKKAGGAEYQYFDFPPIDNTSGGIDGGNIRTVFLVNRSSPLKLSSRAGDSNKDVTFRVQEGGKVEFSTNPGQIGFDNRAFDNCRKPIVGLFEMGDQQVIVAGVHFISWGLDTPLFGSRQPIDQPELEKRLAEAKAVNDWVSGLQSAAPNALIVVAGDMNDGFSGPVLKTIQGASLIDGAAQINPQLRYSLINDGLAMLFDHILVSNNATDYSVNILHINTLWDEQSQVSDHDPVILSLGIR